LNKSFGFRFIRYQKVTPPEPDPFQKSDFLWFIITFWPCLWAICAAFGTTPGGGG